MVEATSGQGRQEERDSFRRVRTPSVLGTLVPRRPSTTFSGLSVDSHKDGRLEVKIEICYVCLSLP